MIYSQNCEAKCKEPNTLSGRDKVFSKFNQKEIKCRPCQILSLRPPAVKGGLGRPPCSMEDEMVLIIFKGPP